MDVNALANAGSGTTFSPAKAGELIDSGRKNKDSMVAPVDVSESQQKVQPEELLDQIKALTEDGQYSVRFEKDEVSSDVVVKIWDNEAQEVVRQIPPEELMNFKATFSELVGNIVDTKG